MDPTIFARMALLSAVLAISSPNAVPPTPAAGYTIYVVQTGDTLISIATQFSTTPTVIEQANHIDDPTSLVPGEKLQVPVKVALATPTVAPTALTYTVKPGDTLFQVAAAFGVSVDDLAQANGIKDVNTLSAGQVLNIPNKSNPLPDGVAVIPPVLKQGNTVEIQITATDIVSATGTFAGAGVQFVSENGKLFALSGISRCANVGSYPVALTVVKADGTRTPLNFGLRVNATNYPVQDITLTQQMASLLDPAIERAENARVASVVSDYLPQQLWSGPFRMPLKVNNPPISALFGERRSYNGGPVGLCGHEGQDFAVDGGTPVYAPADGVVVLAQPLKVRGNVIFLDHGLSVFSGFYHLSEIDVTAGQRVKAGDFVGKVGTTGFSTGDHLHWSMWVEGVYVDPIEWTNRSIP